MVAGDNGIDDESGGSLEKSKGILYGTIFGTLGLWCLCVVVSTKGCRKFGDDDQHDNNDISEEVDPVWVQASVMSRAERLHRQQQRQHCRRILYY
jgi:hypothetical protein